MNGERRLRRRVLTALAGAVLACVISFVSPSGLWNAGQLGSLGLFLASVAWASPLSYSPRWEVARGDGS